VIYKYKDTIASLKRDGFIKECPIDIKTINNLIKRSFKDIETAKRNLEIDNDCSYNYAYNAILHAGLAFMESKGYRPDIIGKHTIIVKFINVVLGKKFSGLINNYDFMRKKRHKFIYEPDIPCSKFEAEKAINTATELIEIIKKYLKENNPQLSFDF
jgi:uncharacterized protein (UPF0332 family)